MCQRLFWLSAVILGMANIIFLPASVAATNTPLLTPQVNGSDSLSKAAKRQLEDPLHGVIVNRTVTVQGHEFYQYFSMWWRQLDEDNKYSITIYERPSARWGSEVWVEYRNDRVFHVFLPPARSQTKQISEQAAQIAFQYIEENELEQMLHQSEDLGPEEM